MLKWLFVIHLIQTIILILLVHSNETLYGLPWNFTTTLSGDLVHDPCEEDWQALTVRVPSSSSSDCRVITLDVHDLNLQGSLSSSLGNLDAALVCWLTSFPYSFDSISFSVSLFWTPLIILYLTDNDFLVCSLYFYAEFPCRPQLTDGCDSSTIRWLDQFNTTLLSK